MRLKERIGSYHKYVDNCQLNNPDPISTHFINGRCSLTLTNLAEAERFDKDFAVIDKKTREVESQKKLEVIEKKRVEKYGLLNSNECAYTGMRETLSAGSTWTKRKTAKSSASIT